MSSPALNPIVLIADKTIKAISALSPLLDLGLRLWVARVFWNSGLTKIQSWDTTLMLFEYEYAVPLLPSNVAAVLATGVELAAPVLLVLGLGTRVSALALFVLNAVAVIAYSDISIAGLKEALFVLNAVAVIAYSDISIAGLKDHYLWGALLMVTFFHGPGKLSVDHFLSKKLRDNQFK